MWPCTGQFSVWTSRVASRGISAVAPGAPLRVIRQTLIGKEKFQFVLVGESALGGADSSAFSRRS